MKKNYSFEISLARGTSKKEIEIENDERDSGSFRTRI